MKEQSKVHVETVVIGGTSEHVKTFIGHVYAHDKETAKAIESIVNNASTQFVVGLCIDLAGAAMRDMAEATVKAEKQVKGNLAKKLGEALQSAPDGPSLDFDQITKLMNRSN